MEGDESNFGMAEQAAFYHSFTWRFLKQGHLSLLFLHHHFKCLRLGPSWLEFHRLGIQDPTSFSVQRGPQMFPSLIFPDVLWWVCPNTLLLAHMPRTEPWVKWLWVEMVELSASHFVAADTWSTHGEWLGEIGAAHCPWGSPQSKLHISTEKSNWAGDFYCYRITHGIVSMHKW